MKKLGIIIPAGGSGCRMEAGAGAAGVPKQFMLLCGEPVLARVIRVFRSVVSAAEIVVALPKERFDEWVGLCADHGVPPHKICEGGRTRFHSVRNALGELSHQAEYIAVHDAARPLVSAETVLRIIEAAHRHGTAIPATRLTDSVRRIRRAEESGSGNDGSGGSGEIGVGSWPEDRNELVAVQTPQVFRADILRKGYEGAASEDFTDDAGVVESVGYNVMLCEGERRNIKITEPVDLIMAEAIIRGL